MDPLETTRQLDCGSGNIILVGLMGAGKTSVGRVLARLLGKAFVDSDHEIERATGVRIPVIFEIEGEAGFRAREHKMIAELVTRENILLATGGGAVLSKENRELLRRSGTVIYLRAPVKSLLRRTHRDRTRPLLQIPDPAAKLNDLYVQRDPLYRDVAHLIVDTGNQSVRTLAGQIEARLNAGTNQKSV
ncbi:MAG TPA: shikimate kinase [Burkholderiales bacterium]|nr:shikimate kinase [Burkholderiales bacterium]